MNRIKSFSIYREYYELLTLLPRKDRGELALSILEYMFEDKKTALNENQLKIFNNLKRPLDKSKNKSKSTSNQNQNEIKSKSNDVSHQDVNVNNYDNNYVVNVNVNIFEFIESNFGRTLNPIEIETINTWEDNELVRYAIKESVLKNIYSIKYIDTIIQNYKQENIKTVAKAQEQTKKIKKSKDEPPKWLNKENKTKEATPEEQKELNKLLEEFK